jgi:flavin-dependent dehydrogenase
MAHGDADVLIIGAGPAGCLAAATLHRENVRVRIVEKALFPRFVIGESLLPSSMDLLAEAGLLEAVERQGFLRKHGAVFCRGEERCDFDFSAQLGDGWAYTYQVPRAEFDLALATAVAARGVDIAFGHEVTAVDFRPTHARATIRGRGGETLEARARFVLDCSGYGRVLPRLLDLERPSSLPTRASLFTHVMGDARPKGRGEGKIWICIHPADAWLWIIPFSDGRTSVGAVGRPEFFRRFSGTPTEQLRAIVAGEPNAARRLANAELVMPAQRITGYSCAVERLWGDGFALAGNATEFLDPVFSGGVTLALASARRAAGVIARQLRGEPVDWQADYADHFLMGVNTFRAYIDAWYDGLLPDLFFAQGKRPEVMRRVCAVLAGYVWDAGNPYVTRADRALGALRKLVRAPERT